MKTQGPKLCGSCKSFRPDAKKTYFRGCYLRLGYCARYKARVERCDYCLMDPLHNETQKNDKHKIKPDK